MTTQQTKILVGTMDKESSPESVDTNDHIDAHNIRNVGNEKSDANYTSALEGTRLITKSIPVGQNLVVGGARFESISKAFYIRQNSAGYHQLIEFDYNTEQEVVLFENLTDSGDVDIFPIDSNTFFSDIRLLDNRYLLLNDGVNGVFNIDIERLKDLKSSGSNVTLLKDDILLIRKQNLVPPTIEYVSDSDRSSNSLRGNLFQFRTQYVYKRQDKSSWSTVSKRIVPSEEPANGQGQLVNVLNALKVSVKLDNFVNQERVDSINIGFRTGLNNWLLARTVKISHILSLASTSVQVGSVTEAYDPSTKTYTFLFYNDGTYPILDQVEVNNPYDAIPEKAETIEIINGNVVAIGGLTEGKDRPEVDNVSLSVTYYADNISNSVSGVEGFNVSSIYPYTASGKRYWEIYFQGAPKAGDKIILKLLAIGSVIPMVIQYTVTPTDEANGKNYTIENAINSLKAQLPSDTLLYPTGSPETRMVLRADIEGSQWQLNSAYVLLQNIGSLSTQSISVVKTNSSYQLALLHFDENGKYFPIVTDDRFVVRTDSLAKTEGFLPQINWSLPENAPRGAVSYQWAISENQTFLNHITLLGIYETSGSDSKYLTINLTSLKRFNQNEKESSVNYDFTKGDKVTFIKLLDASGNLVKWFKYPFIELDIIDFKIEVNPSDQTDIKYLLKIRNTDLLDITELTGKDIVMELWTPKGRTVDANSEIFYEIGEQYPIVNGKYSKTVGSIKEADTYYRGRFYASGVTENSARAIKVEDANFSDNYESKYWSAGRARTYSDEVGKVELPASIRYSAEYIRGSKTFGFNTFYLERVYGEQGGQSTSKYGWIRKLEARDNGVVCIQERKVGIIPNYKSIVYDNTDTSLVADSGKIFGGIQYRIGNYGVGVAKESICVSRDSIIYFIDSNNCVPIRDSYSGLDVIDNKMTHYFIEHIQKALNQSSKIIGYFDDLNREYNITTQDRRGILTNLSFKDSVYQDSFPINYDLIENITSDHGTGAMEADGILTYYPTTDYLGDAEVSFDYFGKTIHLYYEVVEGDVTPDPFFFANQINQPQSTLVVSDSIIVTGINAPVPISIVNGEFQINGIGWLSGTWVVQPNDTVRVRHTTASTPDTETVTTLTIGGVSGTFKSKTASGGVTEYLYITHSVIAPDPQTGTKNRYGVKVTLSHELPNDYTASDYLVYKRFGSNTISPTKNLVLPAGDLVVDSDYFVTDADPTDAPVNGFVIASQIVSGDLVVCEDMVTRVAQVTIDFTNA